MEPEVSLILQPQTLIESEGTVSSLTLTLSEPPPDTGIVVRVNAPNLSEFDLTQAQIEGGEITLEEELQQELQTGLDGTRAPEVPGAVVAIVSPSGSWYGASGVADLENDIPVETDDLFQVGSITKTFVAATILKLVEEGALTLEDTLTTWLPETITEDIANAQDITLRQILQHTSGIPDYLTEIFNQAAIDPTIFLTEWQPEELTEFVNGLDPLFAPGESLEYSNTNFILAGLIIEAVTGNNLAQEIRDRILTPLGLENTFFAGEEEVNGEVVNAYWDFDGDGTLNNISFVGLSWAWAAGAMISNLQDLDIFARGLFKGELLEEESLEQMLDIRPTIDNPSYDSYGLGVGTIESPNRFWYIHRGQTLGHPSNMWYSPQDDLTYIELINGFSDDNLVRDILPPFRRGIADEVFEVTLTQQTAQITLPVLNDGEIEGEEIAIFTLETGEGYSLDPEAQTGTFTIVDGVLPEPTVSLSSEPELLIESQQTPAILNFALSETPTETGITVTVDSPNLSEFNLELIQVEGGELQLNSEARSLLTTELEQRVTQTVPGATIAVTSPLGNWVGASGLASIEDNTPLTPGDRFEISSITKPFVATTILKLVEAETLSLDNTLTDWLATEVTDIIPNAETITVRQLLNHTSGVAEYTDTLFGQAATNPTVLIRNWEPEELVQLIDEQDPFFAPGEGWQYSNTNYILAGMVIEAATGNNVAEEIRSKIFEPLDLENTFFAGEEEIPGGYVSGYIDFDGDGVLDNTSIVNPSAAWTTGAIVSNTEDLTTFAQALYQGDLLSEATQTEMFTLVDSGDGFSYGLGMMSFETPDLGTVVGHRGGTVGFNANMWYSSEDDFTYVDIVNGRLNQELVRDVIPAFREGVIPTVGNTTAYEEFDITLREETAQITLPVANDGETEEEETATFTLEEGEDYDVDTDAETSIFTIVDTVEDPLPNVALGAFPNQVVEGDTLTLFFEVANIPEEGLYVYVDSQKPQSLSQFDLENAGVPGGESLILNPDLSGFAVKIFTDNPQIELPVIIDEIAEETIEITYELKTRSEISAEELAAVETVEAIGEYTINPLLEATIEVLDEIIPNVALGAFPNQVLEGDTLTLFFEFSDIPEDGLYIYVDSETPQSLS